MITKNPMQLKAFIKNKAAEKHISAQLVMQNYMLERPMQKRGSSMILTDYTEIMDAIMAIWFFVGIRNFTRLHL